MIQLERRTEEELFELMLAYIDIGVVGLCHLNKTLYKKRIINFDEYVFISVYINSNRPSLFSSWSAFCNGGNSFYWTPGKHKQRIKWLKQQIKKFKNT